MRLELLYGNWHITGLHPRNAARKTKGLRALAGASVKIDLFGPQIQMSPDADRGIVNIEFTQPAYFTD